MRDLGIRGAGGLPAWIVCLVVLQAAPTALAADAAPASAPHAPAATAPAAEDARASQVASNFAALMSGSWKDIALFAAATVFWAVVWAVGLFLLGLVVGLIVWLLLRRRVLAAPWRWYRYVGWLWAVLFILSTAIGFAYAGAWLGSGRRVKHAIRHDRMIDRIVCNLYFAVVLDQAEYEATGKESAEEMEKVLADSETLSEVALADWQVLRDETISAQADGTVNRWLMRLAADSATDRLGEKLSGLDPRVVLACCWPGSNTQEYLQTHPDAEPIVAAVATHFDELRRRACSLVDGVVLPHVLGGVGLALGGPLALAGIFYVIVVLTRRRDGQL